MVNPVKQNAGLTLRQAAIVTGLAYLSNPVSYAEFSIYPRLVIAGNIEATVQNISTHPGLFVTAILCYLASFIGDVVLAWSLYFLLAPVNQALSALSSLFQLVYAAMALCSVFSLVTVRSLVQSPDYLAAFGTVQLHAQILLLLRAFHNDWGIALSLFGIHLVLLGWLAFFSGYIPRLIGVVLMIAGLGWVINFVGPYVLPRVNFDFTFITSFGEVIFLLWLLIRGWKIKERVGVGGDPALTSVN